MARTRLPARKGTFSTTSRTMLCHDRTLLKGYQSRISMTAGRLTAMLLLARDRTKNDSAPPY